MELHTEGETGPLSLELPPSKYILDPRAAEEEAAALEKGRQDYHHYQPKCYSSSPQDQASSHSHVASSVLLNVDAS